MSKTCFRKYKIIKQYLQNIRHMYAKPVINTFPNMVFDVTTVETYLPDEKNGVLRRPR